MKKTIMVTIDVESQTETGFRSQIQQALVEISNEVVGGATWGGSHGQLQDTIYENSQYDFEIKDR